VKRTSRLLVLVCVAIAGLTLAAVASAHARVSPSISLANELQLYSLAVPTEKENAYTTKIVLTLPKGFSIDSFAPSPGWERVEQATGTGEDAVITQVTWSGGHVPTEEDSFFQFLAQASTPGTYTFHVQQTYSDGSIVDWSGPESAESPAPTIDVVSSISGGGGTSTLTIVALVLGALGLLVGCIALFSRGGRALT
jgi:uncharacterized protein YcnI